MESDDETIPYSMPYDDLVELCNDPSLNHGRRDDPDLPSKAVFAPPRSILPTPSPPLPVVVPQPLTTAMLREELPPRRHDRTTTRSAPPRRAPRQTLRLEPAPSEIERFHPGVIALRASYRQPAAQLRRRSPRIQDRMAAIWPSPRTLLTHESRRCGSQR